MKLIMKLPGDRVRAHMEEQLYASKFGNNVSKVETAKVFYFVWRLMWFCYCNKAEVRQLLVVRE